MAALLGALKVQKELGIPAIGGKDSMSGTFEDINVPPALLSFAVCAVDANNVISAEFKERASRIVLLPAHYDENKIIDFEGYKKNMDRAAGLIKDGTAISADSVRKGGVFMTLFRMCAGNKMGAEISGMTLSELGRPCYGGIVLEIIGNADLEEMFEGVDFIELGRTVGNGKLVIETGAGTKEILLDDAVERWKEPLESVFPVRYPDQKKRDETVVQTVNDMVGCSGAPAVRLAKPKVVIPVFQGTNCEVDSARAFERAGADVDVHLIRNLDELSLVESIGGLATKIKESQIIMVPGGFSGGDEPDGSAKFITAVFRNPLISEDVKDLLENRDGLMLGICNGFQAFVKLGLLPYGEIRPMTDKSPTLTYNKIGRHVSTLVRTRVCSRISPWLQGCELGDVYTIPVSHGEGNFVCDEDLLDELLRNGQIATQYVDYEGRASNDIEFNPNGSVMAIEGITSRDGRIFGKMGHAERIGKNVYKNVPGPKDMKIFESGVNYFK